MTEHDPATGHPGHGPEGRTNPLPPEQPAQPGDPAGHAPAGQSSPATTSLPAVGSPGPASSGEDAIGASPTPVRRTPRGPGAGRRIGAVGAATLALAALVGGGAVSRPPTIPPPDPVDTTGRTVTVCPPAQVVNLITGTRGGELATRALGSERADVVPSGRGVTLAADQPTLVVAEGRQSTASAASSFSAAAQGAERGLATARCVAPSTTQWFTGLYSGGQGPGGQATTRSEIVLVNTDSTRADVDLRLLGPDGQVSAPGARGLTVPARSSRVVGLETLTTQLGPFGVQVRASRGRIHATVVQKAAFGALPGGTDWQVPSAPPSLVQVVPGVPDGKGERTLVVTNPGERRTTAKIEIMTPDGTFAPAEASQLDINGASTAQVSLTRGLAEQPAAVRVSTDQPVTAAVVSHSGTDAATSDVAFQPSAEALGTTGVGALAVAPGITGAALVTNVGLQDTIVSLRLLAADGRELKAAELPVRGGTTQLWEIAKVDEPAGLVVRSPRGATVHAGIVLTGDGRPGLATTPVSAPEPATSGAEPEHRPGLGSGN
ncbi:hypothetical protein GCM10027418_21660 [Mariniluteicoccus endophyticus]